jgi:hypothetical protein
MRTISFELLLEACKAMKSREDNAGCWVEGEIPPVFYNIRDKYYPALVDDSMWLLTIEAVVKNSAVNFVANNHDFFQKVIE